MLALEERELSFQITKLKSVLETEYSRLSCQDAPFGLMRAERGGNSRPICLIPMPADGYNVPYLKEVVGGSTLIYIRPMKGALSMENS